MTFKVFVDDNFHYMDESERYPLGEHAALDDALVVCRQIVDEYLNSAIASGVTLPDLMASYVSFGEDPFIVSTTGQPSGVLFSARDYARERCESLIAQQARLNAQAATDHWSPTAVHQPTDDWSHTTGRGDNDPAIPKEATD